MDPAFARAIPTVVGARIGTTLYHAYRRTDPSIVGDMGESPVSLKNPPRQESALSEALTADTRFGASILDRGVAALMTESMSILTLIFRSA